jgi:eukaryotic-like serine/threonine-protein kinase
MQAVAGAGRLVAGRYRLNRAIGRGAMGIVWRGRDELLDRDVAVKEVQVTSAATPAETEIIYRRTLREARTAARLSHPSVVTVFDVVEEDGTPWIVMELVRARSLDRLIAEDGPLPPAQAALVGEGLLGALATAHAAGVLHRDVKPSNVLVTPDGRIVLTDFGIATFEGDPGLTQVGMVVGTPGFTAPERVRGRPATPASDLWSLGATLYAAVEGRGPFDRPGGSMVIMDGIVNEAAPRAPSAGTLAPVIDALLRADPGTRPDSDTAARLLARAASGAWGDLRPRAGSPPDPAAGHRPAVAGDGTTDRRLDGGTAGGGAAAAIPAFMDTPAFADLAMPGPDTSAGFRGPAGRESAELPAFMGSPAPVGSPASRRGPRGRVLATVVAAAAAVVLAAAGIGGLLAYSHSRAGAAGPGPAAQSGGVAGSARLSRHGAGVHRIAGRRNAGSAAAGAVGGQGAVSKNQSAARGAARAAQTGTGAGSGGAPPPGFRWEQVSAASLGSTAGFKIAVPDAWQLNRDNLLTYLQAPPGTPYIEIDVTPFAYPGPLREASYLEAQAQADHIYHLYHRLAMSPASFRGAPAAAWRFRWQQPGVGPVGVLEILCTLPTSAGPQSYALAVSAPAAEFPTARAIFRTALRTFTPLP